MYVSVRNCHTQIRGRRWEFQAGKTTISGTPNPLHRRDVFRILILWVLSVNKIFFSLKHTQQQLLTVNYQIFTLLWTEKRRSVVKIHLRLSNDSKATFLRMFFIFITHTATAFDSEQLDFYLRVRTEPKICCENSSVSIKWLKPHFWGCCFFEIHTGTAFDSEQLDFHLGVLTGPKICCENSSVSVNWF